MSKTPTQSPSALLYRLLVLTGGGTLMIAMLVDAVAVLGRHTRTPLLGSIEIVQIMVGISGALALVVATIHGKHAMVRILVKAINPRSATIVQRINALVSGGFFLALCVGSLAITAELWDGFEESELWHLPYAPLRVLVCLAMGTVALIFFYQASRRKVT